MTFSDQEAEIVQHFENKHLDVPTLWNQIEGKIIVKETKDKVNVAKKTKWVFIPCNPGPDIKCDIFKLRTCKLAFKIGCNYFYALEDGCPFRLIKYFFKNAFFFFFKMFLENSFFI